MLNMPLRATGDGFHESWRLKWPFLLSHLVFSILVLAGLAPLTTLALRAAVGLSGKPALSDFDIAMFLLSPAGFVAMILAASLFLATYVLDVAFMMAIALHARRTGQRSFEEGVGRILPRLPRIIGFAWRLLVRVVAIVAPFLGLVLFVASRRLTEFDINYYLSEHPPEFVEAASIIGVLVILMLALLVYRLLGWAAALPMVLFEDCAPRESFAQSSKAMRGRRMDLLVAVLGWGALSLLLGAVTLGAVGLLASGVVARIGADLDRLALALLLLTGIWSLLNLLVTSVTTGALACLLMERAGWPGTAGPDDDRTDRRHRLRNALLAGLAVAVLVFALGAADLSRQTVDDTVQIIAHRGAAGARPENTMAAFELAIEDRADWIELDVQESAEGEVIVIHDSDFMKLAGVDLKAWDATTDEMSEIDIGSWFDPAYADQRTPTLRQVLDLARDSGSGVLVELKYYGHDVALEQSTAEVIEAAGMTDQVMLMSLKYEGVQKMKELRPDWTVGLLATAAVGKPWELEADFLAMNKDLVRHGLVRSSQAAGKPVFVWTVNDPLAMSHMLSLGVSGLITDEPALARQVVEERAALNTVQRLVLSLGSQLGLGVSDKVYRDGSP